MEKKGFSYVIIVVFSIGAIIIIILASIFITKKFFSVEPDKEAEALMASSFLASSINSLYGVDVGYVTKTLKEPLYIEIYEKEGIRFVKVYYNDKDAKESRVFGNVQQLKKSLVRTLTIKKQEDGRVIVSGNLPLGDERDYNEYASTDIKDIVKYAEEASEEFGVERALILAVIRQESNFNPSAVSPAGAMGLMQIMPKTAIELNTYKDIRSLGLDCYNNAFEPRTNVFCGTKYLSVLFDMFRNRELVIAAYNAGPGRVKKCNCVPDIAETRNYVRKVQHYYESCYSANAVCDMKVCKVC